MTHGITSFVINYYYLLKTLKKRKNWYIKSRSIHSVNWSEFLVFNVKAERFKFGKNQSCKYDIYSYLRIPINQQSWHWGFSNSAFWNSKPSKPTFFDCNMLKWTIFTLQIDSWLLNLDLDITTLKILIPFWGPGVGGVDLPWTLPGTSCLRLLLSLPRLLPRRLTWSPTPANQSRSS